MARPSKYDRTIPPNLENIKKWLAAGVPEHTIAENLSIAYSTWRVWKNDKPEFKAIFSDIAVVEPRVKDLEANMVKLANGYQVEVKKATKCKETYFDEQGRKCTRENMVEYTETVFVPPNFNANRFLLTNWDKSYSNDPALMRQRKEEFEHKKKMDEENNW